MNDVVQVQVDNKMEVDLENIVPYEGGNLKQYVVKDTEGRILVSEGRTWKAAKRHMNEIFKDKGTTLEKLKELIEKNQKICLKNSNRNDNERKLKMYLHLNSIPKCAVSYAVMGNLVIDIVQLDKVLRVPDGASTHDFILNNYGKEALDLTLEMI